MKKQLNFFGTDGIRGIIGKDLDLDFFVKLGNAISKISDNRKVLIARDTRLNGEQIKQSLIEGLSANDVEIFDAGIIPTGALCFLTQYYKFDFGIMITASHNPSEYNGIKIFNKKGLKISKKIEFFLENNLKFPKKFKKPQLIQLSPKLYFDYLSTVFSQKLSNIKIFLDCANGATSEYAKFVFSKLGATVCAINTRGEINKNACVLDKELFKQKFAKSKATIGFCFDGDGDRAMCITEDKVVLDGDRILYVLAKHFKQKQVVGTIMTNYGLERVLFKNKISLIRTDVGDRNIAFELFKQKLLIGAEESGHVIIKKYSTSGDGLITALTLLQIYLENPKLFHEACSLKMLSTYCKKIYTKNKKVISKRPVKEIIKKQSDRLNKRGRLIARASGTEPVIRITVECNNKTLATSILQKVCKIIELELEN